MWNKVLQFSTIGNRVKYQIENSLICNQRLLGFVFGAITHRIFQKFFTLFGLEKSDAFFLGDFTKSHSKVIFFDITCVWVLFRCLTESSILNHVPYFSDIGNRVKYQNVNSLLFNLGLFSFCFGCYYLPDLFEICGFAFGF